MRKHALSRYFVFKMKLIELIHLHLLLEALREERFFPPNLMGHDGQHFAGTVRTAYLSWYCTIVDRSNGGLDAFKLWHELFPKHRARIDRARDEVKPHWGALQNFRNECGFHAGTPQKWLSAKSAVLDNPQIVNAAMSFLDLAKFLISKEEEELTDFVPEVETLLLDFELGGNFGINRKLLKQMGILPQGSFRKTFG
jgi:hypothetical protein